MGSREHYDSVTKVIQAFAGQRVWRQVDLARHVGIEVRTVRSILSSLLGSGMPLEKEEEHPHVYWSVPNHWFPGGVIFDMDDWQVLVHAVLRIGDTGRRRKLLGRLLAGRSAAKPSASGVERLDQAIAATPLSAEEHEKLLVIEQSVLEGTPIAIHYYSVASGQLSWRVISPQKVFTEPHGRVCAFCHNNKELRWFRIDNIQRVRLEREQARLEPAPEELNVFLLTSVDGYRDGATETIAFRVRSPECGWVRNNLLPGMTVDEAVTGNEIRVVATGASLVVARYVAGLGGAGVAEGEALKGLVRALAEATLEANASPIGRTDGRS